MPTAQVRALRAACLTSGVIALLVAGVLPFPGGPSVDVISLVVVLAVAAISTAAISLVWPTTLRPWARSPVAALPLALAAALTPAATGELLVLVPGAACLVALAHAEARSAEHSSAPIPLSPTTALGAGAAFVVAAVALAIALPWTTDALPALAQRSAGQGSSGAPQASVGGSSEMDLRARGRLPDTPVFVVPAGSPNLWRTQVLSTFDGGFWVARDVPAAFPKDASRGVAVTLPGDTGPLGGETGAFDVQVLEGALGSPLIAPGRPTSLRGDGELLVDSGGKIWLSSATFQEAPLYAVTAELATTAPTPVTDGSALTAPPIGEQWDELPQLPDSVLAIASSLRRADAQATAQAVEDYLVEVTRYDLDAPVPAANQDVTEDFLLGSKRGFCEHYASAAAVLLRANGIAARVVVGYSRDTADPSGVVKASDAHAWTEYWVPNAGWATLDPTARAQLANPSLADRWPIIVGLLALLSAVALSVVLLRRRRVPVAVRSGAMPTGARPRDAFVRLERRAELKGRGRMRGQSLRAFAAGLLPGGPPSWRAIEVVEQDAYGARGPSSDDAAQAVELLDRTTP